VLGAGGTMGFAMARNIARAGIGVRAWNRTPGKAAPLADDGAYLAATLAEAAAGAGVVLTMLSDADAVVTAMESPEGALPVMAESGPPDQPIWLQMSTIGEETTDWCAGLAGRYDAGFVGRAGAGHARAGRAGRVRGARVRPGGSQAAGPAGLRRDRRATYLASLPEHAA
jgi:3-hydroxyisobutyrate dehydrogenase